MRSQSRSSLSTLLFLVPLFGVPLMAIFGVPQFVPVIASSVSEDVTRSSTSRRSRGVGESAVATPLDSKTDSYTDERIDDLFRPSKGSQRDSRSLRSQPYGREIKFAETSAGADTWLTKTSSEDHATDIFSAPPKAKLPGERGNLSASTSSQSSRTRESSDRGPAISATERSDQGLTWRDAVRRLNDLGIQEFRLEPGRIVGEFYFACQFAPDRDARITRRFEAEAKEPLLAVAAVLRQIDEWQPQR